MHTHLYMATQRPAETGSSVRTCMHVCTHNQHAIHNLSGPHTGSLFRPSCAQHPPFLPEPGSLPTCFGNLAHRYIQLLRHVAQHREDGEASQDAGDGVAQSDNEGVSARRSPGSGRVNFAWRSPPWSTPSCPSPPSSSPGVQEAALTDRCSGETCYRRQR